MWNIEGGCSCCCFTAADDVEFMVCSLLGLGNGANTEADILMTYAYYFVVRREEGGVDAIIDGCAGEVA